MMLPPLQAVLTLASGVSAFMSKNESKFYRASVQKQFFLKKGKALIFKHCFLSGTEQNSFNGSVSTVHMYSHFPAGSTKCTPPRILLLDWSHVLIHMLLQWLATTLVRCFTGSEHPYARENWPEQIHRWRLHLLLCTKLWSVVRTPGGLTRIYQLAEVQHEPEEDFAQGGWGAGGGRNSCEWPRWADSCSSRSRTCRLTVGGILRSKLMSISDGMTL